jgi:hypothetical protein
MNSLLSLVCRDAKWRALLLLIFAMLGSSAMAQQPASAWQFSGALDLSAATRELALGDRDKGLGLGHSDVSVRGPLGSHFDAQATVAAHTHERKFEAEIEEFWVQTRTLPGGFQVRAGRFASQIGYLNEQHPHADDFVQRPLLHRAFLGGHWYDDGLRINWTAPTDLYARLGLEVFRGRQLVREAASAGRPGAMVLSGRVGGDIGRNQGWQAGLSFLQNRREPAIEVHAEHEGEQEHVHGGHGAAFSGRRMWLADLAWKWSPDGNTRQEQVRVSYEHAVISRLNRFAAGADKHHAGYLGLVWRFAPAWETGARIDVLRVRQPHEELFESGRLREASVMIAYRPTHAQALRLQFTRQRGSGVVATASSAVQLQYILNFGAHAAHSF